MDPRNRQRWGGRTKRFTLRDTPLTLRAKAAARAGLSLADLSRFTDGDSPTHTALYLNAANPAVLASEAPEELALAEVPTDPVAAAVATRFATYTGHARPWGPALDRGSLTGAIADALTAEESAALAGALSGGGGWAGGLGRGAHVASHVQAPLRTPSSRRSRTTRTSLRSTRA